MTGDHRTHHSLFPEVNAHCGCELAVELVVSVPVEESGLSHPRVPQSQQLDQIVIVPVSHGDAECSTCHSSNHSYKAVGSLLCHETTENLEKG